MLCTFGFYQLLMTKISIYAINLQSVMMVWYVMKKWRINPSMKQHTSTYLPPKMICFIYSFSPCPTSSPLVCPRLASRPTGDAMKILLLPPAMADDEDVVVLCDVEDYTLPPPELLLLQTPTNITSQPQHHHANAAAAIKYTTLIWATNKSLLCQSLSGEVHKTFNLNHIKACTWFRWIHNELR